MNSKITTIILPLAFLVMAGSSLAYAQQPPLVNLQKNITNGTPSSSIFYKGPSLVGIRIYDYYNKAQWQVVQNFASLGFEIKSVIPASQLPNSGSPMGILVVLEKK